MHIEGGLERTGVPPDPFTALDGLLPGLAAALLDLFDVVDDCTDGGRPDARLLLLRVCHRLLPRWEDLPVEERVLAVLDAVRVVLGQR